MHNIHINDAVEAYRKINRLSIPDYAKPFDLAMVNFTVRKINGGSLSKKIIQLTHEEYVSYVEILKQS